MSQCDRAMLSAYSLDLLGASDRLVVEEHLAECVACGNELFDFAELRGLLDRLPAEAFLEGSPESADLAVRSPSRGVLKRDGAGRYGRWRKLAATVLALIAALGLGGYVGRKGLPGLPSGGAVADTAASTPGPRVLSRASSSTGVRLSAEIIPEPGWIEVRARFYGVRAGLSCRLVVQSRRGAEQTVLSWIAPERQPATGVAISGAVVIAPNSIVAIKVVTFEGKQLVSIPIP